MEKYILNHILCIYFGLINQRNWSIDWAYGWEFGAFSRNTSKPSFRYASVDWISIGRGNGPSPVRQRAIAWIGANLLSVKTIRHTLRWYLNPNTNILSRATWVNPSFSAWWRHQMETFSALLAICAGNSPVPGEFPTQRPVTRSFDVFFDLRLNKRLSKQSWGWWFETLSRPCWRHCNGTKGPPFPQTTFSNAFSRIKSFVMSLEFHWRLFLKVQLAVSQLWFW